MLINDLSRNHKFFNQLFALTYLSPVIRKPTAYDRKQPYFNRFSPMYHTSSLTKAYDKLDPSIKPLADQIIKETRERAEFLTKIENMRLKNRELNSKIEVEMKRVVRLRSSIELGILEARVEQLKVKVAKRDLKVQLLKNDLALIQAKADFFIITK